MFYLIRASNWSQGRNNFVEAKLRCENYDRLLVRTWSVLGFGVAAFFSFDFARQICSNFTTEKGFQEFELKRTPAVALPGPSHACKCFIVTPAALPSSSSKPAFTCHQPLQYCSSSFRVIFISVRFELWNASKSLSQAVVDTTATGRTTDAWTSTPLLTAAKRAK